VPRTGSSISHGHDLPRLIDEPVPRATALIDDVVVVLEDAVRQPVVSHELPHILDRVQFRRPRRQEHQGDVVRHFQLRCDVPSGLVENEHCVRAGIDSVADFGKVFLHRLGVAIGKDEASSFALFRADRAEDISPHGALVVRGRRSGSSACPTARDLVLLPYSGFVGPPDFDVRVGRTFRSDLCQRGGEIFLKTSPSNSFWAYGAGAR